MKINLKYANKEVDQVLIDLSKVSTVTLDVHNKYISSICRNGERKSSFHLSGKIEIEKMIKYAYIKICHLFKSPHTKFLFRMCPSFVWYRWVIETSSDQNKMADMQYALRC